jgi:hypothetical protein
VHEMVHHWQAHRGDPRRGRYHNHEWADRMEARGLMPSHTGEPGGRRVGQRVTHYIIAGGRFEQVCDDLLAGVAQGNRFPVFSSTRMRFRCAGWRWSKSPSVVSNVAPGARPFSSVP